MKSAEPEQYELQESTEDTERRFQDWFSQVVRGKWVILGSTVLVLTAMYVYTKRTKPVYEASTMVLINAKSGQGVNPLSSMMEGGPSSKLANELGILKTRSLAEAVARALLARPYLDREKKQPIPIVQIMGDDGPTGQLATVDQLTGRIRGWMEFVPERESDLIKITARSNSPDEAALLANTYAEAYQEQTMLQSRSRSRSIREFLENRLTEQRDTLSKAEGQMRGFMEGSGVVSLDQESNTVVEQIATLEATRNALDLDIETYSKRLASMEQELPRQESQAAASISQANDSYIRQLQEQLGRLEVQRDVIVAQSDPSVLSQSMYQQRLKDIDDQIKNLRKRLEERSGAFIQSFLAGEGGGAGSGSGSGDAFGYIRTLKQQMLETKFQLETLRSRRNALAGTIRDYEQRFKKIPRQSIEFARLQRERLSSERLYGLVEERYNEAAITEKSEFGYVDIIDRAIVPNIPVSPDIRKNMALGLLLGLGLGIGLILLKDIVDVRARTPEQLRKKGYFTLAEVAPMHRELTKLKKEGRKPREVGKLDSSLWLVFDPLSMLAESYRRLRTTLLRAQLQKPLQVVLVTSASPGEGKSTTAVNLALTLSETQKRILLIDADIRKPRVHALLGTGYKPGLTDYVNGQVELEAVVQRQVVEHLDFIPSGTFSGQPSRVFSSRSMMEFIEHIKEWYDFILIDAPPALVVNDASVLAGGVDTIILVASAGQTRMAAINKSVEILTASGGNVFGIVLNNFDARRAYGGYYGGYKYGHYASYRGYYTSDNGEGKKNGKKGEKKGEKKEEVQAKK